MTRLKSFYFGEKMAVSTGIPSLRDRIEAQRRKEALKIIQLAIQSKSASVFLQTVGAQ